MDVGASGSVYRESYSYDGLNRVSAIAHRIDSRTYTNNFQYNQINQPTQEGHMYLEYDSKARLFIARNSGGSAYLLSVSYNIAGQVTADSLGNGVTESYGYNNRMQLITQNAGTAAPYTNRMNVSYNYEAIAGQSGAQTTAGNTGQLMSLFGTINGVNETAVYYYDNVGRLATSNQTTNGASAQRRFAYDRWGNRTGVWDAVSGGTQIQSITLQQSGAAPTNQIASVNGVSYSYDAAGNVTNDGAHSYTYDAENRVVSVDGGAATYAYDYANRRIKKVISGVITHCVWEGSRLFGEYNGSTGAQLVLYYYAGSRMVGKLEATGMRYFLSDRLSARLMMDGAGNVVGRQGHLPYGEDFGESGEQQKQHFTSYERDSETGTDYAMNRQYGQSVGRFNRVDPLASSGKKESPQSWNRYSYAIDDPINKIDRMGLDAFSPTGEDNPCDAVFGVQILPANPFDTEDILCFIPLIIIPILNPAPEPEPEPCSINSLTPFSSGMDRYSAEELNAAFQALVGEASSPAFAHSKIFGPIAYDQFLEEAIGIASAIFNRADFDYNEISQGRRAQYSYDGNPGTIIGVVNQRHPDVQVAGYVNEFYKRVWNQASALNQIRAGTEFCGWLEQIYSAITTVVNSRRYPFFFWRPSRGSEGWTTILLTEFR